MTQEQSESSILEELDNLDKAIIRLKVDGHKNTEIAEKLEKNRQTIDRRVKKLKVQRAIAELQKKAIDILLETQSEAAWELRRIIRSKNSLDSDKIRAAKEVLKGVLTDNMNLSIDANSQIQINFIPADGKDN